MKAFLGGESCTGANMLDDVLARKADKLCFQFPTTSLITPDYSKNSCRTPLVAAFMFTYPHFYYQIYKKHPKLMFISLQVQVSIPRRSLCSLPVFSSRTLPVRSSLRQPVAPTGFALECYPALPCPSCSHTALQVISLGTPERVPPG